MRTISGGGVLTNKNISDLNANFAEALGLITLGNIIYCQPSATGVQTQDGSQDNPYTDLPTAWSKAVGGQNDVIVLVGNGAANGSARLSTGMTWSKDAVHLIGLCSPVAVSQRARIAPTSGATAFTPFFTVSANGCIFKNIQWFHGFDTGTTAQINMVVTGSRNYFADCHIAGMGDQTSADSATSRSLKLGGSGAGENVFDRCTIGLDTVTRGAANASVEFTGGAVRNLFRDCIFPFMCDATTPLGLIGSAASCMDRWNIFEDCVFFNAIGSTSTTMAALATFPASPGGLVVLKNPSRFGITDWGTDANSLAAVYVDGAATGATDDIGRGAVAIAT